MPEPVEILFSAGGVANVLKAIGSVDSALAKLAANQQAYARGEVATTTNAGRAQRSEADKTAAYRFKVQLNSAKMAGKVADQQVAEEKAAAEKQKRTTQDLADYRLRVQLNSAKMATKILFDGIADEKKVADQKIRLEEQTEKRRLRVQENAVNAAHGLALREIRQTESARARFASASGTIVGQSVRGALGLVGNMAGGLMALGGGFGIADAVGTQMRVAGLAKDIELRSGKQVSAGAIQSASAAAATQYGYKTEDVLQTANQFIEKSGSGKDVLQITPKLVELASASGAGLSQIGELAAKFHMMTGNADQTMDLMRMLVGVGRIGSIDIADLGSYGSRIVGAASSFEDKTGAAKFFMGALQSTAEAGKGINAAEATEGLTKFGEAIKKHKDDINAMLGPGKNVFDKGGKGVLLRDPKQLILDMLVATGGKQGGVSNLFEDIRAKRAIGGYEDIFQRTYEGAGGRVGGDARINKKAEAIALEAVISAMAKYESAILTAEEVTREAAERASVGDRQLEAVMNHFRTVIGDQLLPKVIELIPQFEAMIPAISRFVGDLAKDPMSGIGEIIAAKMSSDIIAGAIGTAAGLALEKYLLTSMGASLGAITILAGVAYLTAKLALDADNEQTNKDVIDDIQNSSVARKLSKQEVSSETQTERKKLIDKKEQEISDIAHRDTLVTRATEFLASFPAADNLDDRSRGTVGTMPNASQDKIDIQDRHFVDLQEELKLLRKAYEKDRKYLEDKGDAAGPNPSSRAINYTPIGERQ